MEILEIQTDAKRKDLLQFLGLYSIIHILSLSRLMKVYNLLHAPFLYAWSCEAAQNSLK